MGTSAQPNTNNFFLKNLVFISKTCILKKKSFYYEQKKNLSCH